MSSEHDPLESTRKRLMWRASRRGIKEMDLVVGGFATEALAGMTADELQAFEAVLDIPDQQLLAFVTGQEDVPQVIDGPVLRRVLAFRPVLNRE
jgi:antitoxin CptB